MLNRILKPKILLAAILLGLATLTGAGATQAQEPAAVVWQELELTPATFGQTGQLDGLAVTPTGLALAASRTEGVYTSGVILSPLAFTTDIVPLWQVDLPPGTALRLETRLSLDGGASWSDWLENPAAYFPVRDTLHSGNLIWVGSNQAALQFRVALQSSQSGLSPLFGRLVLAFSDTSQGPSDAEIAGQQARVAADGDVCPLTQPAVVSRTDWGNPEKQNSPRRPLRYAPVTHVIIHQTETPNSPGPYQDWAGWVRSVWNYHANILRWGDVGYNYLIDPNGVIYEGRAGGDNVIGIHDTHNAGSMAIGFLGCYGNCDDPRLSVAQPAQPMLDSAVELMAWKLEQQGVDPLSAATYDGLANIPAIAGGRDVTQTSSPGANLYNQLPTLRADAAARIDQCNLQPCQITGIVFSQESYQVGDDIRLTVRLADHAGTPLAGAEVTGELSIREASAQAATGIGLIDRAGEYDSDPVPADVPGFYDFDITAADPTGERFLTCTASVTVEVNGDGGTSTPTPTPTVTPTPTPTPTGEPPAGVVVKVDPASLEICDTPGAVNVVIQNVENLAAAQLELLYDPAVVQVVDADPGREGVQVTVGSAFSGGFVAQNTVDATTGRVSFAATLFGGDNIDGDATLITVDWDGQTTGNSALTLENIILVGTGGQSLDFTAQNGAITVASSCSAGVSGVVALQGRANHGGIKVVSSAGAATQTAADGSFTIAGGGALTFEFPGYLTAQADPAGAQAAALGKLTLLAGDVNGDNVINILDLAYIAKQYRTADPMADLTSDGVVDILDLALAANNYQRRGPLTAWQ